MQHKHRTLPSADYEATLTAAVDHYAAGRYEEATRLVRGLMVLDPEDARLFKLQGSILLLQGYRREAEVIYRRALVLDSRDPYTLAALAEIALDALRIPEAVSLLKQLFALDPDGHHPAANRGRQLLQQALSRLAS